VGCLHGISRDERRLAKQRIKAIVEGELIGKAVNDAVLLRSSAPLPPRR
jgi:hypothetical protein